MSDEEKRGEMTEDFAQSQQEASVQATPEKAAAENPLFCGSYTHGIDAKGRMIVPSSFRNALGDKFVVAPTLDFQAIALYPTSEWIKVQDKLEALLNIDARAQRLINQFNKYSYSESETDAQGRLLLPQKLRGKYLGEAREVEISGAKSHIRVVETAKGAQEDEDFMREIPDPLAFMAELQRERKP